MAALVGDVTEEYCVPALLFQLLEVVFNELEIVVCVVQLVPQELVVPIAALSIQGEHACFQVGDVFDVVAVLVPAIVLGLGHPEFEFFTPRVRWTNRVEVPLIVRESIMVAKSNSKIPAFQLFFNDIGYVLQLLIDFVLGNEWIIMGGIITRPE